MSLRRGWISLEAVAIAASTSRPRPPDLEIWELAKCMLADIMRTVWLLLIFLAYIAANRIDYGGGSQAGRLGASNHHISPAIDESFYSRQLLVYGQSAQAKLANSKVLLVGKGGLLEEVVKNLALTGIGHLVLSEDASSPMPSLTGNESSLVAYAKSLNPHIHVESMSGALDSPHQLQGVDAVVACDESLDALKQINRICRQAKVKMVASSVLGVVGFVFNDFLDAFTVEDVDGEAHKEVPLSSSWEMLSGDGPLVLKVRSIPEERLDCGLEDVLELRSAAVTVQGVVKEVLSPHCAVLHISQTVDIQALTAAMEQQTVSAQKMKQQKTVHHQPLMTQLLRPSFNACNGCLSSKQNKALSLTLLAAVKARHSLRHATITNGLFRATFMQELKLLGVSNPLLPVKQGGVGEACLNQVIDRMLLAGRCCPATVSVIGALTSQEVIKAISGMYEPVSQFLMIEALDTVEENSAISEEVREELARMKVFVVGAGAIGCELLKNFALLGVGAGRRSLMGEPGDREDDNKEYLWSECGLLDGGILLTDMDCIERSNLNRQLLFRERHIGQAKALIASAQIHQINPAVNIHALSSKVCSETEHIFNDAFWQSADVVVTALDNVEARKYVDRQCLLHKKFLLDSGTLGTKANSQVILPYLTETYSSSTDPPEEAVALCTIKSFPYQPEHCVAWAKSAFLQYFQLDIRNLQAYQAMLLTSSSSEAYEDWSKDLTEDDRQSLTVSLSHMPLTPQSAIAWAKEIYTRLFEKDVEDLLEKHPLNALDEDSTEPFWGGSRRIPTAVRMSVSDPQVRDFIAWSALLRLRSLGDDRSSIESIRALLEGSVSPSSTDHTHELELPQLLLEFQECEDSKRALQAIEFEKDDRSLGHVQWAAAASNLRSRVYGIREIAILDVQKIAGNIIPALATTTALIGGLVTHELIKLASERVAMRRFVHSLAAPRKGWFGRILPRKKSAKVDVMLPSSPAHRTLKMFMLANKERLLRRFRNSFVNLARPLLAFTQPVEASALSLLGTAYNLWDQIEVMEYIEHLTPRTLSDCIHDQCGMHLTSVSFGNILLYADFLHDKHLRFDMPLDQLIAATAEDGVDQLQDKSQIVLEVTAALPSDGSEGSNGWEVALPPVVVLVSGSSDGTSAAAQPTAKGWSIKAALTKLKGVVSRKKLS